MLVLEYNKNHKTLLDYQENTTYMQVLCPLVSLRWQLAGCVDTGMAFNLVVNASLVDGAITLVVIFGDDQTKVVVGCGAEKGKVVRNVLKKVNQSCVTGCKSTL